MPLIILGHPHFEKSLANRAILDELLQSPLEFEVREISKLYPDYNIDAKAEQEALTQHQTIIFQYPFYWYTMPAILKHWFDVVLEYGFAYGTNGDKLKGKNFVPVFTVGGPENEYQTLGEHHFRVYEYCRHLEQTAYYAQMNYIDPFYFHGTSLNAGYAETAIQQKAKKQSERLISLLQQLQH